MTARVRDGELVNTTAEDERDIRAAWGRARRRQRAAGRRGRITTGLAWAWENMVHVDCGNALGWGSVEGATNARRGTRTRGWNNRHQGEVAVPAVEAAAVTPAAPAATPAPAVATVETPAPASEPELCGRAGYYMGTRGLPCVAPKGHSGSCRYERTAQGGEGVEDALAALSPFGVRPAAPSTRRPEPEPEGFDASVERFKLLDLDDTAAGEPEPEPEEARHRGEFLLID
jgi:hypothetical protein